MNRLFSLSVIVSVVCCQANTDVKGNTNSSSYHNYDFIGRDFRNTQTKRLCLLARLNASFEITYNCDSGHWRLEEIELSIQNASWINDIFPQTRIKASVVGSKLSANGDEITTGVSVARGYECYDHILSAQLDIHEATDLKSLHNATEDWKLVIHVYGVEIQPFLVTNHVIKDPVLCRDVTTFVVLIIAIPLVYFFFFVVIYRLKERYGCPSCCNKKHSLAECNGSDKKPLVDVPTCQTPSSGKPLTPSYKNIAVTCTSPDQAQHALL